MVVATFRHGICLIQRGTWTISSSIRRNDAATLRRVPHLRWMRATTKGVRGVLRISGRTAAYLASFGFKNKEGK